EKIIAEALGEVLNSITYNMRYDLGYSLYGLGVYTIYDYRENQLEFGARLRCPPEEYLSIRKDFNKYIKAIKEGRISVDLLLTVKKELKRKYVAKSKNLQEKLYNFYKYDTPVGLIEEIINFIDKISLDMII